MPLSREDFQRLRNAGFSPEQIASFEARRAAGQPEPGPEAGQVFGPEPTIRRAGRAIPFITGALGSMVPGGYGIPGATVGGMAGKAIEKAAFGEPQDLRQTLESGVEQAAVQAPAAALGVLAKGLIGARTASRIKAEKTIRDVEAAVRGAQETGPEVSRELARAEQVRRAAGSRAEGALAATPTKVRLSSVARDISGITGQSPGAVLKRLRRRIPELIADYPDGATLARKVRASAGRVSTLVSPSGTRITKRAASDVHFTAQEANMIKRAFQASARAPLEQKGKGMLPPPRLDLMAARSFRRQIGEAVAGTGVDIHQLNRETKAAIAEFRALARESQRLQATAPVRAIRAESRVRGKVARDLAERSPNLLRVIVGVPAHGVAGPKIAPQPKNFAEFLGRTGEKIGPKTKTVAWLTPRILDMMRTYAQAEKTRRGGKR